MRFISIFICIFFGLITFLPSLKAIKEQIKPSICNEKSILDNTSKAGSCQNEKCLLNFSSSISVFIVFETNEPVFINTFSYVVKNNIHISNFIKSKFNNTPWQPPELL